VAALIKRTWYRRGAINQYVCIIAVALGLGVLFSPERARTDEMIFDSAIASLAGLGQLDGVLVEEPGEIGAMLSRDSIRAEVEAVLHRVGLLWRKTDAKDDAVGRYLHVHIASVSHGDLYAVMIVVALNQSMAWVRPMPPSSLALHVPKTMLVPTWSRTSLGVVSGSNLEPTRRVLREATEAFVRDYQPANSAGKPK
jgi:hypothetical protein